MTEDGATSPPSPEAAAAGALRRGRLIKVWDAPTRWVHGLIIVLIALAWWTESHDQMAWHVRIGCALLGVVAFRLAWGVVGGVTARFSSFVRGPRTVLRYGVKLLRGGASEQVVGHNPMGGWSVLALLGVVSAEIAVGLFCVDVDGLESGPMAGRVSFEAGRAAAHWHTILFNVLLALIALHLCAVAFYGIVRRENLIGPMLTGRKRLASAEAASGVIQQGRDLQGQDLRGRDLRGSAIVFWASALIAAAIAVWAAYGFWL